jgi:hypothetical protein
MCTQIEQIQSILGFHAFMTLVYTGGLGFFAHGGD